MNPRLANMIALMGLITLTGCEYVAPPTGASERQWNYHALDDGLRDATIMTSSLGSIEGGTGAVGIPSGSLYIREGATGGDTAWIRANQSAVCVTSHPLVKIDDGPVERLVCPTDPGTNIDFPPATIDLPPAMVPRVKTARRVVVEVGQRNGIPIQWTFETAGRDPPTN